MLRLNSFGEHIANIYLQSWPQFFKIAILFHDWYDRLCEAEKIFLFKAISKQNYQLKFAIRKI